MLSLLIFFPTVFALLLSLAPKRSLNLMALIGSLIQVAFSMSLFSLYDPSYPDLQLVESFSLIPYFGIHYLLGLDGLSFWYLQLSAFLLPLVILSSWKQKSLGYFFFLFTLVSLSNGVFLSFDTVLFYIFFELSLFPLFFLIFIWGGEKRVYASFKFLIYTFFASLFLLGAVIAMMLIQKEQTGNLSASLLDFYLLDLVFIEGAFSAQSLLFFCFAFAFAVKTPLVPFHSWLPLAHVEAPTGASVYLAALLLKMGTYGWFRFVIPLFPEASAFYAPVLLFLACLSLIYASLVAFAQTDLKKLVAYSSIAHMAYVLIGLFAFNIYGIQGAFYQTLTHGISSAALFLLVGLIYERTGTREIAKFRGLALSMPLFAICFFLITLSSIALPTTAGFVSEFLVLLGSALSGEIWIYFAITGVILGALYMLNVFQKIFFGNSNELSAKQKDLNLREVLYLSPLCALVFIMGLFPSLFLDYSKSSLNHLSSNNYRLLEKTEAPQDSPQEQTLPPAPSKQDSSEKIEPVEKKSSSEEKTSETSSSPQEKAPSKEDSEKIPSQETKENSLKQNSSKQDSPEETEPAEKQTSPEEKTSETSSPSQEKNPSKEASKKSPKKNSETDTSQPKPTPQEDSLPSSSSQKTGESL